MGVAFYHTLYESLGSVAFALEKIWTPGYTLPPSIHAVDNLCAYPLAHISKPNCSSRQPSILVRRLWEILGVLEGQLVNYATSFRGVQSPDAVHAKHLIYDCSNGNPRGYWHIMKLRQLLHRRFQPGAANRSRHILMISREGPCATCGSGHPNRGRSVHNEGAIEKVLKSFGDVVVFKGDSLPLPSQLRLFQDAKLVVGPHGAAESLLIFCERGTPVIEYVHGHEHNSGLYAGYAHMFDLPYWTVVSRSSTQGYNIDPEEVGATVSAALQLHRMPKVTAVTSSLPLYQVHGCQSIFCAEGCCHYPCCPSGFLQRSEPYDSE